MSDFQCRFDSLQNAVSGTEGQIMIASDFDDRALEWGILHLGSREKRLLKMIMRTSNLDRNHW